jgi:hypothetical protein
LGPDPAVQTRAAGWYRYPGGRAAVWCVAAEGPQHVHLQRRRDPWRAARRPSLPPPLQRRRPPCRRSEWGAGFRVATRESAPLKSRESAPKVTRVCLPKVKRVPRTAGRASSVFRLSSVSGFINKIKHVFLDRTFEGFLLTAVIKSNSRCHYRRRVFAGLLRYHGVSLRAAEQPSWDHCRGGGRGGYERRRRKREREKEVFMYTKTRSRLI